MSTETYLPGFEPKPPKQRLEVHEHCFVRGPRSGRFGDNWPAGQASDFEHSHIGGDIPHSHPLTGPSSYTPDKDDWFRRTGLSGGGRKKFTTKPSGEQFDEMIPRTPEESAFEIIMFDPPSLPVGWDPKSEGGGHIAAANMVERFKLTPILRVVKREG